MGNNTKTGDQGTGAPDAQAGSSSTQQGGNPNPDPKPGESGGKAADDKPAGEAGKTDEQQQAAQKTGDQSQDGKGGKAGDSKETPKVPDKYELKVPDGVALDSETRQQFEKHARTVGMTNDEAQAFLEDQLSFVQQRSAAFEAATKADPDYGGDRLEETQRLARKAIDRIRPEGHKFRKTFLEVVNGEGVGNHLQFVSFLADIGRMMGEDKPPRGGASGGATTPEAKAQVLYDNPMSKAADGRS